MAIPFLQHLDLKSSAELRNALLHKTTEGAAVDALAGIIYDTESDTVKYHNGSLWISLTANTDNYVDGASLTGTDLVLTRTGSLPDLTIDLSSLDELVNDATITIDAGTDLVTGGSFTLNQASDATITIDHGATARTDTTSTDAPAYGETFEAVTGVTTNAQGHVTAIDVSTVTIPASDNIDEDVNVANLIARLADISENVTIGDAADVTVIIPGNLQVTGTTTTNNVETVSTSNGVVFEGNAADDHEVTLLATTVTADRTIVLPDAAGTVALTSDIKNATLTVEGTNGLTGTGTFTANDDTDGTITISHADTSSQASVDNSGRTYIQDITLDTYGHITAITSATETVVNTNTQLATASAIIDVSAMAANSTASFTHSLASKNLIVQLYDTTSGQIVHADVDHTSVNAISIIFASTGTEMAANSIGDIRVIVIDAKNGLTDKAVSYS